MPDVLTERFEQGLVYAAQVHGGHRRKSTDIPYLAHLMSVAALVLEDGGSEDEAIAALLHDAIEDQPDRASFDEIGRRFGAGVEAIVRHCTETEERPKPPWRDRKESYVERMRTAPEPVLRVAAADKLHNARATLSDVRAAGDSVWARFGAGRAGQLWYYRSLTDIFTERLPGRLSGELDRVVSELERQS
jgi:(p)ppGpp synthase/HD superfamily hydrolase